MAKSRKTTVATSLQDLGNVAGNQLSEEQAKLVPASEPMPATTSQAVRDGDHMVEYQEQQNREATEEENNGNIGDNSGTFSEIMTDVLLNSYTPQKNEDDAAKDATCVLANVSDIENEMTGPLMSRLSFDMADILHAEYSKTKSALKDKGISVELNKDLVTFLKNTTKLGKPTEISQKIDEDHSLVVIANPVTSKEQAAVDRPIDMVDPYKGKSLAYIQQAAMRACLLVFPRESRVCIGYTPRKEMQGMRFHKKTVFLREIPKGANPEDYFSAVCVPSNVVYPKICISEADSLKKTITMVPYRDNPDDSLRHLSDDWCYALYNHVLGEVDLAFDYEGTETKKPTGLLLKQAKVSRATGGTQNQQATSTELPKDIESAHTMIRKLQNEAKGRSVIGAANDPGSNSALESYSKALKEAKELAPRTFVASIHVATAAIRRLDRKRPINPQVGHALAAFLEALIPNIGFERWESDGVFQWLDDNGNVLGTFESVDESVVAEIEEEKAA